MDAWSSTNTGSDYNPLAPTGTGVPAWLHSIMRSSTSGIAANPATDDFHLVRGSPASANGIALSTTGCAASFDGVGRSQSAIWDIGTYAFGVWIAGCSFDS